MPGPLFPMDPIDMSGHGGLRVEVHRFAEYEAAPGPVGVQVMGTDDGVIWANEGEPVVLYGPGVAMSHIRTKSGRIRLHGEIHVGSWPCGVFVRVFLEP